MSEVIQEVVVGATRKNILVTIVDADGNPVNITGGTVFLQGTSADLPDKTLDVQGTIHDGPNGVAKWAAAGGDNFVTAEDLGEKISALFDLRAKFVDSGAGVDYGPLFYIRWLAPPIST
jgi:hypothetical protein